MKPFTLAIDDTDTRQGGCTTHFLGLLLLKLAREDRVVLEDYPLLVRLAPGVPYKTRGNAAVAIRGWLVRGALEDLVSEALEAAQEYSNAPWGPGKEPGIAVYPGVDGWREPWLRKLYREALSGLVSRRAAEQAARKSGARLYGGRGAIGAAAALAALAPGDPYTFELLAYRRPEYWGTGRCVRHDPMIEAWIPPCAFNNFDLTSRTLVAAPHGPDPVLAGFRGTCPEYLGCYERALCEEPHFWVLYRSNQHTDTHHTSAKPRPYSSLLWDARIVSNPDRAPGGHLLVRTDMGVAAAYRETGPVRELLTRLPPGARVLLGGTLKPRRGGLTLGIEKVYTFRSPPLVTRLNPRCPRCGARMKSAGRRGGYKCARCGYRAPDAGPIIVRSPPPAPGEVAPPPGRIGHLVRPPYVFRLPSALPGRLSLDRVVSPRHPPLWTMSCDPRVFTSC